MKRILYLTLILASTTVLAEVAVPNTFVANTPASADEVNDNFITLEDGVNVNAANVGINSNTITTNTEDIAVLQSTSTHLTPRVIDKNGTDIGTLLTHNGSTLAAITAKGYVYTNIPLIDVQPFAFVIYESADCSGVPHVSAYSQGNGSVFNVVGQTYYVDKNAVPLTTTFNSSTTDMLTCNTLPQPSNIGFPITANDTAITGAIDIQGNRPFIVEMK